jgi:hypothetical protein
VNETNKANVLQPASTPPRRILLDDLEATRRSFAPAETVRGFLRNTRRVVSVVVHAVVVIGLKDRQMMLIRHRFQEFDNPAHRFDLSKGWLLFRDYQAPKEWGGMPPKWHRIFSAGFLFGEKAGVIPLKLVWKRTQRRFSGVLDDLPTPPG